MAPYHEREVLRERRAIPISTPGPAPARGRDGISAFWAPPWAVRTESALENPSWPGPSPKAKDMLGVPADYLLGILPGSDTGALRGRPCGRSSSRDQLPSGMESFSEGWATDVEKQLKLSPMVLRTDYRKNPDLGGQVDWATDVVFVANGTTGGVKYRTGNGFRRSAGAHAL